MTDTLDEGQIAMDRACAAQEEAARLFKRGDERDALLSYRDACSSFRIAMSNTVSAEGMRRYLLALQGLTVAAAVTGGIDEARLAAGTGGANAAVARDRWPTLVFDELARKFDDLADRLGGGCAVFVSENPASWPFDD